MGEKKRREAVVRQAVEGDIDAIYTIGQVCFSDAWRRGTIEDDFSKVHSRYYVAEVEGKTVGYGCFWFVLDEAQLVNIAVLPEARKQGVGKSLFEAGLLYAIENNMASLFLEVRVSNLPAQELYRKHGFAVVALRRGVYTMPNEDGYIMSRKLFKENV